MATIYMAAATLDGFIADDDDSIDWLTGFEPNPDYAGGGGGAMAEVDLLLEDTGALIMGSSTYDFLLGHSWPYGDRPTWVLTSRGLETAEGADIRFHNGPVADIHPDAVAAAGGQDVWLVGGGGIASDLLEAGLIDEVRVTLVPIYLGTGKRLFDRPVTKPMNVTGHRTFAGGMAHLDLEPAAPDTASP